MNKSTVCARPGWTSGRVDRFLVVEHIHIHRGMHGRYEEHEYSIPQILEAEKSPEWRIAAAKYLKVSVAGLDARISDTLAARAAESAEREAENAARIAALHMEIASVRGGLCRIGCLSPLSDGWRRFAATEVLEYVDFADRRGRIDGDYIREFYRLWSAGAGYCNPKGVLRRLIAPVKDRIIRILLYLARRDGWVYGVARDTRLQRVLYFDTSGGQVSFHLTPWDSAKYPPYTQPWSGLRNSDAILAQLFDPGHRQVTTQQEAIAA